MVRKSKEDLKRKCAELLESPVERVNHVPGLLAAADSVKSETLCKLILETLGEFFAGVIERGEIVMTGQARVDGLKDCPEKVYLKWIMRQYSTFKSILQQMMGSNRASASQVSALGVLMDLLGAEYVGEISKVSYFDLCNRLIKNPAMPEQVRGAWMSKYFTYADLRYYTLLEIARVAAELQNQKGSDSSDVISVLYDILISIPSGLDGCLGDEGKLRSWCGASEVGVSAPSKTNLTNTQRKRMKRQVELGLIDNDPNKKPSIWCCENSQRLAFSSAWLSFLRLPLSELVLHKILNHIPENVIPHMKDPQMLCDFLTTAMNAEGLIGVLALNGIFILVTRHGLEYPEFYKRLYGMLRPYVFHLKHRVKFWKLVDRFLASGHVPAYTAAAFIKRLGRMSIEAPPFGAMTCVSFIHNLLRRHPSCDVLVHRPDRAKPSPPADGWGLIENDVYDAVADDPAESRAIESSLWEIEALRNHSCPQVAKYVTMLDKDLTKKRKTSEADITLALAASYTSLFDEGVKKRVKVVPLEIHEEPITHLFGEDWW
ncbi:hypothetical protein BSKO_08736 [Bryopsis sp. KO-2023]|nr:hypothetical protein BSKO_08736 [Bryopsis sp. KO-2023]